MAMASFFRLGLIISVFSFWQRHSASGFLIVEKHTRNRLVTVSSMSATRQAETVITTLDSLSDFLLTQCASQDSDPEGVRLSLLKSRLEYIVLSGVSTGLSTITGAGQGLFATQDCPKGELLTCYPGDALMDISADPWRILAWGDHVRQQGANTKMDELDDSLFGYMLTVDDDYGILGLPDCSDSTTSPGSYLGHFANDGAALVSTPNKNDFETSERIYTSETNSKCNAKHTSIAGGSHMATIATRDIRAGEEIFVTYGPEYWAGIQKLAKSRKMEQLGLGIGLSFVSIGAALALLLLEHS